MGVLPISDSVDPWNGLSPWFGDFSDLESMLSIPLSSPCYSLDRGTGQSGDMGSDRAGRPSRISSTVLRLLALAGWAAGSGRCGGEWVWPGPGRSRPPGPRPFKCASAVIPDIPGPVTGTPSPGPISRFFFSSAASSVLMIDSPPMLSSDLMLL